MAWRSGAIALNPADGLGENQGVERHDEPGQDVNGEDKAEDLGPFQRHQCRQERGDHTVEVLLQIEDQVADLLDRGLGGGVEYELAADIDEAWDLDVA